LLTLGSYFFGAPGTRQNYSELFRDGFGARALVTATNSTTWKASLGNVWLSVASA